VTGTEPTALPVGSNRTRAPLFRHPWRIVIVVAGVVAALNLGAVVLNNSDDTRTQGSGLPTTILSLQPRPGELIRPQDTITVELRADLTGTLVLDRQEIPPGQLAKQQAGIQNVVSFRPGPGTDLDQFSPGTHEVTVEYWSVTKPRPTNPGTYSWTFRVGA
jgi:hypothetical protein